MPHSLLFWCELILSHCMLNSCRHKFFNITVIFDMISFLGQCDLAPRSDVLILLLWLSLFIFILKVVFPRNASDMTSRIFSKNAFVFCLRGEICQTSDNMQAIFFWAYFLAFLAKLCKFLFHLVLSLLMSLSELFLSIVTWRVTHMI
jgi:hypothetical protein